MAKLQNNLDDYAEGVVKAIATYTNTPYTAPGDNSSSYYVVQKGDTLWGIAQKYNISVDQLKSLNNLVNDTISIGQKLIVSATPSLDSTMIYTVQKGDTLWGIAQQYNISVEQLKSLNNLTGNTISVGQKLIVSPNSSVPTTVYTVQRGDSLWSISQKYGISVNDLIQANNLSNLTIYVGQELIIPNATPKEYVVQKGDTLWGIAQRYNVEVNDLAQRNGLTSTTITPGQVLIIP